jgi:hypothetical protein
MEGTYGNQNGNKAKDLKTTFRENSQFLIITNWQRKWSLLRRVEFQGQKLLILLDD